MQICHDFGPSGNNPPPFTNLILLHFDVHIYWCLPVLLLLNDELLLFLPLLRAFLDPIYWNYSIYALAFWISNSETFTTKMLWLEGQRKLQRISRATHCWIDRAAHHQLKCFLLVFHNICRAPYTISKQLNARSHLLWSADSLRYFSSSGILRYNLCGIFESLGMLNCWIVRNTCSSWSRGWQTYCGHHGLSPAFSRGRIVFAWFQLGYKRGKAGVLCNFYSTELRNVTNRVIHRDHS